MHLTDSKYGYFNAKTFCPHLHHFNKKLFGPLIELVW